MKKLVFLFTVISLLAAPLHAQPSNSGGTSYWGLFGAFSIGVLASSIVWIKLCSSLENKNRTLQAASRDPFKIRELEDRNFRDGQMICDLHRSIRENSGQLTREEREKKLQEVREGQAFVNNIRANLISNSQPLN